MSPSKRPLTKPVLHDEGYEKYYPSDWPDNPFHKGEIALQKQAGVHETVMGYAPRVVRPYMPLQLRTFFQDENPLIVAAGRDMNGDMWATTLGSFSPTLATAPFVTSPSADTLVFSDAKGLLSPHDALTIRDGMDIGLLGIIFATKRRNRVNGRLRLQDSDVLFHVDQAFGNCPQYIHPRNLQPRDISDDETEVTTSTHATTEKCPRLSKKLSEAQLEWIRQSDTLFVATGYRGEGNDVRFGNDASHRGGPAGFVMIERSENDEFVLVLPEFSGNNHFNSLGSVVLDDRVGISFPNFETGAMLQLTGRGVVDMDINRANEIYSGALRIMRFTVTGVNEMPAVSLPLEVVEDTNGPREQEVEVTNIVQESPNVKSLYMEPVNGELWTFSAGQHLPIVLRPLFDRELERSYSLSQSWVGDNQYRISVKLIGRASSFLHTKVKVGDRITVQKPAGDFVYVPPNSAEEDAPTLVLLSAGIGVTPMLSMLHEFVNSAPFKGKEAIWIYGARSHSDHVFKQEVIELKERSPKGSVSTHVFYSQNDDKQKEVEGYDSVHEGRVTVDEVLKLVPNVKKAVFYMCGPGAFLADLEDGLLRAGADSQSVRSETF